VEITVDPPPSDTDVLCISKSYLLSVNPVRLHLPHPLKRLISALKE